MRLGVFENLMAQDSLYKATVESLADKGATIVPFAPEPTPLEGFLSILNIDMKNDLPAYLKSHTKAGALPITDMQSLIAFNSADSAVRIPYGQALFHSILKDTTTTADLTRLKAALKKDARGFFDTVLDGEQTKVDAVLSLNNYHAAMPRWPNIRP